MQSDILQFSFSEMNKRFIQMIQVINAVIYEVFNYYIGFVAVGQMETGRIEKVPGLIK